MHLIFLGALDPSRNLKHCVTSTFAERNRLSFLLSGNKLLSAN